ncbi:hypothetical protein [Singulisphaera acidiphila]|uniref:Uncharacterized protein n=1 Tax=Singulisphaera acidiphila (strain ATCC BAA-1392 / DSM 18658 / VKM B-2454 / MOB10) TaxID=886293 RepID=L0DGV4_SINAD|nr:hypothetical protein [Singulisphaera acidiphila]AGA28048.1 hypothetical protein Sinac_3815 [Singulisphaera acidiphila DSM 18658]
MKSLMFLFLATLGMIELGVMGSHNHCPAARPHATYGAVRHIALATPPEGLEREPAEGLPVPIYPGTRVDTAKIQPPQPPSIAHETSRLIARNPDQASPISMVENQVVTGRISATETRARDDARVQLQHQVAAWLAPDAPASWKPPAPAIDRLIVRTEIEPIDKDYGTLYKATLHVDSTPARRAEILAAYQHELVVRRMVLMGGGLAVILSCLAAVAGYIRADEATKGYYTNWLRAAAAAGVGASGVLVYQLLA